MASLELEQSLYRQISRITLIDPHSHIDPHRPASQSLADLLGYHYYTELAHSAGMDAACVAADVPADRRIASVAKWLPAIENTAQYSWLIEIAHTLLGFEDDKVDASNVERLAELARDKMSQPDWEDQVLRASNIDVVFLTNDFDDPLEGFNLDRYVPCLRCDELVTKLGQPGVRERLGKASGVEVRDIASLSAALGKVFEHFVSHNARACAIGLTPQFAPRRVTAQQAAAALDKLLAGRADADEEQLVSLFVFWTISELCQQHRLPFDLMIGAVRGVYPAGVNQGRDLFARATTLHQYTELFNAFPKVTFAVSVIDSAQNPELLAYSWIFPNVVTSGHWWYANVPGLIDRDLRQRLQAVPRTKQVGYYSDMYKLEFGLPKFNMYKRRLARVLAEEFVRDRGWSEDKALGLARDLLRGNIERIFFGRE